MLEATARDQHTVHGGHGSLIPHLLLIPNLME
ncbi:hypothetical protein Spb1_31360 [Planctopirus ephydatiae]|uniref:Uncharacterized protein n=1 Tax=Planctopirus ephydatiae TaxID=2528019 RepID=A0A518GRG9_9PLAN|nr:hypothetical protein Spb1_31360 [Planctopirus ephydatiae]